MDQRKMSEGVNKLVEYLNQTRRQAELSINILNDKIKELTEENQVYQSNIAVLTEENSYYKSLVEQLQNETTNKSRLQERDDWKCLVESIQKDRSRLQDECIRLELKVEELENKLKSEQLQVQQLSLKKVDVIQEKESTTDVTNGLSSLPTTPPSSNSSQLGLSSSFMNIPLDTPHSTITRLRNELEAKQYQFDLERQAWNREKLSLLDCVNGLQEEIKSLRGKKAPVSTTSLTRSNSTGSSLNILSYIFSSSSSSTSSAPLSSSSNHQLGVIHL